MRDSHRLPTNVRSLLQRLPSLDHVEVLLVLAEAPERRWAAADVAAILFGDSRLTGRLLNDLAARNLVVMTAGPSNGAEPEFRFEPTLPADRLIVAALRDAFNHDPFAVIRAVGSGNTLTIRSLANAFRIRPPADEEGHG
jgi:hypothetical protein